jgi:4-amino-4-deoxy-L-arabinose transferase-like glycosyltransferase
MNDLHRNQTLIRILFVAFAAVLLATLGVRTLIPPDEGRYAEMAREMFASGDWITTRLNGIKYFEKPPLQTWMNALTFTLFGLGDWQARLWTGLCALFGVALTGVAGTRVFGARAGFYAALVLGSTLYWVVGSQANSLDMGVSGMMALALCALVVAQRDAATPLERRNWMLACWAGMALSMLSKGLIGVVLPGGVLVVYTLAARDWRIWTRLHLGKGLLLFFVIAAPWFVLVGLKNPEQPHFFFIHEHFERFLLKEHHREAAWWLFFALMALGSMPWLGVLVQSMVQAARRAPDEATDGAPASTFRPRLLLLVWVVFILLFFTASSSKLPGYILPVFPGAALLIGTYLESGTRASRMFTGLLTSLLGAGLLALVPFMPGFAYAPNEAALFVAYQPWVLASGIVFLIGGALAVLYARQLQRDPAVLALAAAGFVGAILLMAGFEPIGRVRAGADLLPALRQAGAMDPAVKVYSVAIYEQSLTFYLRRPVTLVGFRDEFDFGLQQEPGLAIDAIDTFLARWRADARAGIHDLAITRPEIAAQLQQQRVPLRIVGADGRRTVIANF